MTGREDLMQDEIDDLREEVLSLKGEVTQKTVALESISAEVSNLVAENEGLHRQIQKYADDLKKLSAHYQIKCDTLLEIAQKAGIHSGRNGL